MNNLNELKPNKPSETLVVTRNTTLVELANFIAHLSKESQSRIILKTVKRLRTQLTVVITNYY